jgi:hypothetical protein
MFSDWSAPVNLGPVINSPDNEAAATLSWDRRTLYFASNRPGGWGLTDLYVSRRASVKGPWGPPENLGPVVNSAAEDTTPNLSFDGHWLFFMSRRPGSLPNPVGVVGFDIWVSFRWHVHDPFAWQPPVRLESEVNSPSFDQSPFLFFNWRLGVPQLFFTRTTPTGGNDIFVSNLLPNLTFGPSTPVSELNSPLADGGASVRFDGLEVFFFSRRTGGSGNSDLWTATRSTPSDPWSTPVNLGPLVNSVDLDFDPYIDSSREGLYFTSTRAGGAGGQDLYLTTRTKQKPSR